MDTETKANLNEIGAGAFAALEEMVTNYTDAVETDDYAAVEAAEQVIHEDPLSLEVRSGWCDVGSDMQAWEFNILLTTGGPAVRIIGGLDGNGYPTCASLEVQDWGTPWTQHHCDTDILMTYAQCFYFGD